MSSKTSWRIISTTEPYKLLDNDEKDAYQKEKREYRFNSFLTGLKLHKMPVNKVKFNKKAKLVDENEE